MGWGQKVAHALGCPKWVPQGAVQGDERVFWGCFGGFCSPVVQSMQYMQILIAYLRIHANTYRYLQIPVSAYIQEAGKYRAYCSNIPT